MTAGKGIVSPSFEESLKIRERFMTERLRQTAELTYSEGLQKVTGKSRRTTTRPSTQQL